MHHHQNRYKGYSLPGLYCTKILTLFSCLLKMLAAWDLVACLKLTPLNWRGEKKEERKIKVKKK